jgi:hypothetical protein
MTYTWEEFLQNHDVELEELPVIARGVAKVPYISKNAGYKKSRHRAFRWTKSWNSLKQKVNEFFISKEDPETYPINEELTSDPHYADSWIFDDVCAPGCVTCSRSKKED